MRLLIIGGTGVLSSAVTAEAINRGFDVTMINRGNRKIPEGVDFIKSDKDDLEYIAKRLEGRMFDAVMDYLCFTDDETEKSARFYSKYTKQYFYISSCAVYNTASLDGKIGDEDSPKGLPIWNYSVNKWAGEQKLSSLFENSEVQFTIIRPCVTYGDTRIPYGIMPAYGFHWTLCARILTGKPIITWNKGKNRCNMTRVEDFAVGVVGLIGNPTAYGESFNLCGDEAPTFRDVLDVLSEYLHKDVLTIDIPSEFYAKEMPDKAGEIMGGRSIDTINSNAKIKAAVPYFKQTYALKDGIIKTLNSYKEQNYQEGIDWSFDAKTDRIIKKWCKIQGIDYKGFNLKFVDYIGSANFDNRFTYFMVKNKMEKIGVMTMRIKNKIKRVIDKYLNL